MISVHTFEITRECVSDEFNHIRSRAYEKAKGKYRLGKDVWGKGKYIDAALKEYGIRIVYQETEYKKYIRLIVNPSVLLGGDDLELWEPNKKNIKLVLNQLEKCIDDYFDNSFTIYDFILTDMEFTVNISMGKDNVSEYIQLMHRIKETKKYHPKYNDHDYTSGKIKKELSFDLVGKTNGVEFTIYDKEGMLENRNKYERAAQATGILRIEVRLKTRAAVLTALTSCSNGYNKSHDCTILDEIRILALNSTKNFRMIFDEIVPRGASYKLGVAEARVKESALTNHQKEKMLQLLRLIPEKRSLYKAFLEMQEDGLRSQIQMLRSFADIGISPITISKRADNSYMESLYNFLPKYEFAMQQYM